MDEIGVQVPDVVGLLQERTELTRATMVAVLTESGRAAELRRNPQAVIKLVGDVIEEQKQAAIVDGIQYERTGTICAQDLINAELERDLKKLMEGGVKSVHDYVPVDSDVERSFLKELKDEVTVKLFAKLPPAFGVPMPLGLYKPDWAVLVERDGEDRLYLVVETKGDLFEAGLRKSEAQKLTCGKAHFDALSQSHQPPAQYRVARTLSAPAGGPSGERGRGDGAALAARRGAGVAAAISLHRGLTPRTRCERRSWRRSLCFWPICRPVRRRCSATRWPSTLTPRSAACTIH